ncbi:hypothetical protein [Alloactinosynnema sp. L-07]|uniref:hypothetical protein n=1 Tax=Alloactinosynnema sp. L-07 TaxID=1653480 RepID=UPI00065F0A8A|nr:hypothetical protein [Alloactinosynnema sp. L-07]CRK59293.1 hypothetical protein [Alloactinosynnema sp. L-07]
MTAAQWITRTTRFVGRLPARGPRPLRWLCADPQRLLTLVWLVGILIVGTAHPAVADGIVVGPDLAHGAPRTLLESYDFTDYKLTVKPDDEASGWFSIGEAVLEVIGFINNLILWLCLGILYGALALLQWLLNLTLYRDAAPEVDLAVQSMAASVFWPLIGATTATGAFVAYARWRGEGRGFISDFGWVVAAGVLAVGFAAGPSTVMSHVDGLRQDLATGIMTGAADYNANKPSVTGFPTPSINGTTQEAATRRLVDNLWNTIGATAWCYAEFHDLDICRVAGHHALANDEAWQAWMTVLDDNGNVPEFREHGDWIRGQDMTRTGYLLVLALIVIPTGLLLLRLVMAGLTAAVGFLLMLVIGLIFVTFWAIPGWFRETGLRYAQFTLGMEAQSLLVTGLTSGYATVTVIIISIAGENGFFVVAVLNLGALGAAARARAWGDSLTTVGGASGMGYLGAMLATSTMRGARRIIGRTTGLAFGGGRALAGAGIRKVGAAGTHVGTGGMRPQLNRWISPLTQEIAPQQAPAPQARHARQQIEHRPRKALASATSAPSPGVEPAPLQNPSSRRTVPPSTESTSWKRRRRWPRRGATPQQALGRIWIARTDGRISPLGDTTHRNRTPPNPPINRPKP